MADVFLPHSGKGAEIRAYLEEVLGLPPNLRWFEVRFALSQPVTIRCEFAPMPVDVEEATPPDGSPVMSGARSLDD